METVSIARVAVAAATYTIDKPYDYTIPENLAEKAKPGVRVTVPFGKVVEFLGGEALMEGVGHWGRTLEWSPLAACFPLSE